MKILAVGAHPDDIEIYMFGTLAAARARGAEVALAVATDGAAGGTVDPVELRAARKAEARYAATLLDTEPYFLGFPDGGLVADAQLVGALKALIRDSIPDLVITHAPNDYHGDHRALSDAMRIAANFHVPVLWADTFRGVGFTPTHYVDVTEYFATKVEAIECHISQNPARFVEMAKALNGFRAGQANGGPSAFAEAFRFEPVFPFVDIRDLLPPAPKVSPITGGRLR